VIIPTRGERNNNPGNIERVPHTIWKGQSPDQVGDSRFVIFTSMVWGVRALAKILLTYSHLYPEGNPKDIDTVAEIISRWAPSSENNTIAYIQAVAKEVGVSAHDEIDITNQDTMEKLVTAIIRHENGRVLIDKDVIEDGVDRALA